MAAPLICMTLTGKTLLEDIELARKYESYVDLVELRVDHLNDEDQLLVRNFPSKINLPCILTIRRDVDGGLYSGSELSRTNLFARALAFAENDHGKNFAYVDFEEDYHVPSLQDAAMAFNVKIIRSFHDMNGTVHKLRQKCMEMRKTGFEIMKIAFMPEKLDDVVNLFEEGKKCDFDHIFCAMGPQGLPSRILAALSNSYLTYVSPEETISNMNNIGHLDPITINNVYNFKKITEKTHLFGITGWPLVKTGSPEIHNKGYKNQNLDAVYLPFRTPAVSQAMNTAEKLGVKGMSVTIPHKETVLKYLYEVSPEVQQIGACNTIVRKNNHWYGYNTDAGGFKRAFLEILGNEKIKRKKVAIIGAGGAAKAIAYTIKQLGCKACVFNRTESSAEKLAKKYGFKWATLGQSSEKMLEEYSDIIVQTTSVGMNSTESSNENNDPIYFYNFDGHEILYDVIYVPSLTPVMKRAALAGCKISNGYTMLEYQAYEQYKLFTGKDYESK